AVPEAARVLHLRAGAGRGRVQHGAPGVFQDADGDLQGFEYRGVGRRGADVRADDEHVRVRGAGPWAVRGRAVRGQDDAGVRDAVLGGVQPAAGAALGDVHRLGLDLRGRAAGAGAAARRRVVRGA